GIKAGKDPDDVVVPGFLPDTPDMRSQLLDYYVEIEWFDKQLGIILEELEKSGELENTLVLVTSDNGMPFPRAKTQLYEFGTHMAMVAAWPSSIKAGREVDDLVNFVDLAPTFLEAAGVPVPEEMSGKSFLDILLSEKEGRIDPRREVVYTCHERHDHQRYDNLGYPMRSIRDYEYLYIRNFRTERWPLGDPGINGAHGRYPDTPEGQHLYELTYEKKPAEELYNIVKDPYCLNNLASDAKFKEVKDELRNRLDENMIALKDPRMLGYGDIFDSYPRNSLKMNPEIGGFKEPRKYNLKYRVDKPVIKTYPLPSVYPPSSIYSMEVNGINVPVTEFVVKNKIQYHYAHFSFTGIANVRINLKDVVRSYLIRPLPFEISAKAIGSYLNFTLTQPRYLIVDINEHEKLIVLADPTEKKIPVLGDPGITDILDYDVDQTGQAESTNQIQKAIDQINMDGGGTLYFPPGIYKTRTLFVKDNVNIYLAGGASVMGTGVKTDYPEYDPGKLKSITYVFKIENASNIKIYGRGTIDGLGVQLAGNVDNINDAPLKIRAVSTHNSSNIAVEGIIARELTSWAVPFYHSDHIKASHVKVLDYLHLKNSDGINMCASQFGLVENCFVMVGDDSYCSKGHEGEPTHDIIFRNSVAWSSTRGVTLGMQAYEHMYNILYDSIYIAGTRDGIDFKHNDGTGDWEDIIVKNIFVDECWGKPFNMHIREGGSIKNVIIENYSCKSTGNKSFINGLNEDSKISDLIIRDMILDGVQVKSPESGDFEINQFTSNISFQ
ncbi:MAG: sulfatase-like hydrolase/transferase, partial [Bacteroidales bacterium]|nr:sulfatase-like hydrolase/transferase [Bacteroidales bacterium]